MLTGIPAHAPPLIVRMQDQGMGRQGRLARDSHPARPRKSELLSLHNLEWAIRSGCVSGLEATDDGSDRFPH